MKVLRSTACVAVASVVVSSIYANADFTVGFPEAGISNEFEDHGHLRFLADGSGGGVITPPPITRPPKKTMPPAPSPSPVTPSPPPPSPVTEAPAPETAPPTAAPTTAPTTAPPVSSPTPTTTAPTTSKPTSKLPTHKSDSETHSTIVQPVTDAPSSDSNSADTNKSDSNNKMSTGVVAGIVAGIVGGVALLAFVAVSIVRRRRDDDDDPLSPFELSTDKAHSTPVVLGTNVSGYRGDYNQKANNTPGYSNQSALYSSNSNVYGPGSSAVAAMARKNDTISSYSSNSSGVGRRTQVTSQQFYDSVTSPDSMNVRPQPNLYNSKLSSDGSDFDVQTKESYNLWESAMEPQPAVNNHRPNDVEGYASRPSEAALSFASHNSYDDIPSYDVDIDQSSVISSESDLEKEIPDHIERSSRGSYEL